MPTVAAFYDQADKVSNQMNWMNGPFSAAEHRQVAEDFLQGWLDIKTPERMETHYRRQYAGNLKLYFSTLLNDLSANFLPDKCSSDDLIVTNAAIITDADLDTQEDSRYQTVKKSLDADMDLFNRSRAAGVVPLDIANLQDFTSSFCFFNLPQSRVYLHEKSYKAITEYAKEILSQKPIWLHEDDEVEFTSIREASKERDILHPMTMTTNLTAFIIRRTMSQHLRK